MRSVFHLINVYQDGIIATVSCVIGLVESGICSWAIHRLIMDEQFLIYIIGHAMYKKTRNLMEAMAHYKSLREYLNSDLFEVISILKVALSIGLCSGIILFLASMLMMFQKRAYARIVWVLMASLSLIGLVGSFVITMKNIIHNIVYLQIFLTATGVNCILLLHLILSLGVQEAYALIRKQSGTSSSPQNAGSDLPTVTSSESQTPSIALLIQEEFPLPPPPSPPSQRSQRTAEQTSRTTSNNPRAMTS